MMANIGDKQLGAFLRKTTQDTVEKDRDVQATVTHITNWSTTGELKCALLNGDVIWVNASGNLQEIGVGDVIWVRRFGVGQRSQYRMTGYFKQSGGTYKPTAVRQDVAGSSKVSELWASDGTPQAVDVDASGNLTINPAGGDQDTIIESENEDQLFVVDAALDLARIGDRDTNYLETDNGGDTHWVGGGGLPFGSCYGNEIAWAQASAVQNTWYDISDSDMISGPLHNITHDGNGQLTALVAGMYAADWAGAFEASAANVHVQITFSINGTETNGGLNHFETVAISRQDPCAGNAILDLAANDTVNVSIRTTDAGTPDLAIDHLMLRLVHIGGT